MKGQFDRHQVGSELSATQRTMFFQLGAAIENILSSRLGFRVDPNYAHEQALAVLDITNWKSIKVAKALWLVAR